MGHDEPIGRVFDRIRREAVTDPKSARQTFEATRSTGADRMAELLELASRPGESRVRGVIAASVRLSGGSTEVEPWLRRWVANEPDEFTRGAIEKAIAALPAVQGERAPEPPPTTARLPDELVAAYRYVSERLCHRVRNTMTAPNAQLLRLETILPRVADPAVRDQLTEILGALKTGFGRVGKGVQFDVGDDYLTWQPIGLGDWLETMSSDFASRFGHARFEVQGPAAARAIRVRCTRFLLETAFGNVWTNALQAAGSPCSITAAFESRDGKLEILISDNGPGFSAGHLDVAFKETFSTNPGTRGRGLLEIADAIFHLHGDIELVETTSGAYRVRIRLPVEAR